MGDAFGVSDIEITRPLAAPWLGFRILGAAGISGWTRDEPTAADLPEAHGAILAAGDEGVVVVGESERADGALVTLELGDLAAAFDLEDLDLLVAAADGEEPAVGREGQGVGPGLGQGADLLAGLGVPEADGVVAAAGGEQLAVGRGG